VFIVASLLGGATAAAVFRTVRHPTEALTAARAERALESERAERLATRRQVDNPA
jgi:aquaporin Z